MARPSNTAERRAQITGALLAVMARTGYERATIASIAREAGLTPGLVHYHFDSKEEILVTAVERLRDTVRARYEARVDRAGDAPIERLFAFVDAHVSRGSDDDPSAVAAWVVVGAQAISQPAVRELYAGVIEESLAELRRLFAACLREVNGNARDARAYAAAVMSAIEGAYQLSAGAPGALPEGFAAPTLEKMVRGLLGQ
jgi:TetR/AcrR family transcriptional repressor of bet genes